MSMLLANKGKLQNKKRKSFDFRLNIQKWTTQNSFLKIN